MIDNINLPSGKIEFDKTATSDFYRKYEDLCTCSACQNFYKYIADFKGEKVKDFLDVLGVDICKPVELTAYEIENDNKNTVEYYAYYAVKGKTERADFVLDKTAITISGDFMINTEIEESHFIVEIRFVVPWNTAENISDYFG